MDIEMIPENQKCPRRNEMVVILSGDPLLGHPILLVFCLASDGVGVSSHCVNYLNRRKTPWLKGNGNITALKKKSGSFETAFLL
jgi:hypothetical protein